MVRPLWQLLSEQPSDLSCDECLAVMEYYSEMLAQGGEALLPEIKQHLEGCPSCRMEHRVALRRLGEESEQEARSARRSEVTVTQKERDRE